MDICSFFNSKDIAEYLRSIDYDFTLPEAAYVVYQSEHRTLEEKFSVWQRLIDTMPDFQMEDRAGLNVHKPIGSFHQFLRDYMELQKKLLQMFYDPNGALYKYSIYATGMNLNSMSMTEFGSKEPHWCEIGEYFANAQSAFAYFKREKEDYMADGMLRVAFIKLPLKQEPDFDKSGEIHVEMTTDLEVITVDNCGADNLSIKESKLENRFDEMWFDFPTPFKRGEILIDVSCHPPYFRCPFVLDNLLNWDADTLLQNGFSEQSPAVKSADETMRRLVESGDTTDMDYHGIFLEMDDNGFPSLVNDTFWTYLNLERCEEPLQGMYRVLKPLSSAMTYDPDFGGPSLEPELLCNGYLHVMLEQMCKLNRLKTEMGITEEGRELAGLK